MQTMKIWKITFFKMRNKEENENSSKRLLKLWSLPVGDFVKEFKSKYSVLTGTYFVHRSVF